MKREFNCVKDGENILSSALNCTFIFNRFNEIRHYQLGKFFAISKTVFADLLYRIRNFYPPKTTTIFKTCFSYKNNRTWYNYPLETFAF
jgi:hypothetical protein